MGRLEDEAVLDRRHDRLGQTEHLSHGEWGAIIHNPYVPRGVEGNRERSIQSRTSRREVEAGGVTAAGGQLADAARVAIAAAARIRHPGVGRRVDYYRVGLVENCAGCREVETRSVTAARR